MYPARWPPASTLPADADRTWEYQNWPLSHTGAPQWKELGLRLCLETSLPLLQAVPDDSFHVVLGQA